MLPAYAILGLPIPLGGTSNHFPRRVLLEVGAWDPFNVTEDADLGIRLARRGYVCAMLASITYEDAPVRWRDWKNQRTRWMKGVLQTYLVHTRRPLRLFRDLGIWGGFGFHAIFAGLVLSALVHPIAYVVLAWQMIANGAFLTPEGVAGQVFVTVAACNLGLGYGSAMLLGAVTALRRRRARLILSVPFIPLYWLAISYAAWRALGQLFRAPFAWEKTPHTPR